MHPATLRQFTAGHIREPTIEAGDTRRAGKRECRHRPRCPDALAPGRSAARIVANHPGQGGAYCATAWCCLTTAGHCSPTAGPWLRPPPAQSGRRYEGVPGQRRGSGKLRRPLWRPGAPADAPAARRDRAELCVRSRPRRHTGHIRGLLRRPAVPCAVALTAGSVRGPGRRPRSGWPRRACPGHGRHVS
jgi:hypothetical protein